MNTRELPQYDLWFYDIDADCLPPGVRHVCSYELNLGADLVLELLFLRRLQDVDELWALTTTSEKLLEEVDSGILSLERGNSLVQSVGRPLRTRRAGSREESCEAMLGFLFRARIGFSRPQRFQRAGIVCEAVYTRTVEAIDSVLKAARRKTARRQTRIIRTARELGLGPRPFGTNIGQWAATCPGTGHTIFITASDNEFTCPWCRRKGGCEELRAFVAQRRRR